MDPFVSIYHAQYIYDTERSIYPTWTDQKWLVINFLFFPDQPFRDLPRVGHRTLNDSTIEDKELYKLLTACKKGKRQAQDSLYGKYFPYAMGICLRFSKDREEAIEILNDGFVKIFLNLHKYTNGPPFKGWLRKVMVNTAIDHFRKNEKHYYHLDISHTHLETNEIPILSQLSEKEILKAIQRLPASYRIVFNLFVVEGYKHEEIADQLKISVGTSKSNLAMARRKLKKILSTWNDRPYYKVQANER